MLEDSRCNRMVGMRAQSGKAHVAHHLVGGQILGQRTCAVEMCLHADIERVQPALQRTGLVSRHIKLDQATALKQGMRALGSSIHMMAFELRARHRSGNEFARSLAGAHAIECFKRQHSTQPQRIAAKSRRHRIIHYKQRVGLTSSAAQSAKAGHTKTKPADRVNEPPQVRPLGIKRSIKALGRSSKRRNRRLAHHSHVAGIKAVRKRIGKVIGKGNQPVAGACDPQLGQRRRHMRGRDQSRLARSGPCSPSLFKLLYAHAVPSLQ